MIELEKPPAVLDPSLPVQAINTAELEFVPHPILIVVVLKPGRAVPAHVSAGGELIGFREHQAFFPRFASIRFFILSNRASISARSSAGLGSMACTWP